jgi:hypothetical protein
MVKLCASYIFIAMFGSTLGPCRCQLIRFDQYVQGSTNLPEGYDTNLFNLIAVSASFEGAFDHFRLLTCTFTSSAIMHDVCILEMCVLRHQYFDYK